MSLVTTGPQLPHDCHTSHPQMPFSRCQAKILRPMHRVKSRLPQRPYHPQKHRTITRSNQVTRLYMTYTWAIMATLLTGYMECYLLISSLPHYTASTSSGATAASSTASAADDLAVGMSAGKVGPSCASTELPPLPNASTTPPGTPPLIAASPSSRGSPPSYFGTDIDSNPSTTAATNLTASTTITGSTAGLNTLTTVPRPALESNTSVSGLGSFIDSSAIPGSSATTHGLSSANSIQITTDLSDVLPGSPRITPVTPPLDERSTTINAEDRAILLSQIENITHTCAPQEGKACSTCLFKEYQRLCVDALLKNQLKIPEIADVVSLMGVFVPSRPTERMKSVFSDELLQEFIKSGAITNAEWDSVEFDDSLPMKAVKVRTMPFDIGAHLLMIPYFDP